MQSVRRAVFGSRRQEVESLRRRLERLSPTQRERTVYLSTSDVLIGWKSYFAGHKPSRMIIRPLLFFALLATAAAASEQCREDQHMFECANKKCIPKIWLCDGDNDCTDGSDETDCNPLQDVKCNSIEFKCPVHEFNELKTPASCIPQSWLCDGEPDCPGREDEHDCKNLTCKANTFACPAFSSNTITCAPNSWKCDGQVDCNDGSDEKDCDDAKKCDKDSEFQCKKDHHCINSKWVCDGDTDCLDGSDEENCEKKDCTGDKLRFACKTNNFCIPVAWRCDGERDCLDSSDEQNCTAEERLQHVVVHVNCTDAHFKCKSGNQCIQKGWVCDGEYDCHDLSDEEGCKRPDECSTDEFKCDLGLCRPNSVRCNGIEDCLDGTDEINCSFENAEVFCNETQFECPGKPRVCIDYKDMCRESKFDCSKPVCQNVTQTHLCDADADPNCRCRKSYTNKGFCQCAPGYKLNGRKCVDINECETIGICDQKCYNLPGSYECRCEHGYHLVQGPSEGVPSKCKANGSDPLLFLSNRVTIRKYDLVTKNYNSLVTRLESAVAMDFWHKAKALIWSDVAKEKIMICHMGQKSTLNNIKECDDENVDLITDVMTPDGLAVDWVHGLLFWTDTGHNQINVMNLTDRHRRTIVDTGLDEPRAIAVDPSNGVIFWTDWGTSKIERAGMDGQNRVTIVSGDDVKWPNGLTLDIVSKRIYWADAKLKMISSSDYSGNNIRVVLRDHRNLKHPFSLTVFEERLYWTDWEHDGVLTANKFNGKDISTIMSGVRGPMTVRVYHELVQPELPDKCAYHTCDQLCLPRSRIGNHSLQVPYSCLCSRDHKMENGHCVNTSLANGTSTTFMFQH
uniref:Very low-density lipoprotein receptor n=1 Tax=Steinernema glaseri TaxID=37863 RepID=A0A1I7Z610_9BILA